MKQISRGTNTRPAGTAVLAATSLFCAHLPAQTEADEDASKEPLVHERIVVTAQKREQELGDVPSSVALFDGDSLDAVTSPGSDIRDLSARVPSLYADGSNGNIMPRFYIRGLGNTDFDLNASQPVGMYVDGVVQENVLLESQMMFDIERIFLDRGRCQGQSAAQSFAPESGRLLV